MRQEDKETGHAGSDAELHEVQSTLRQLLQTGRPTAVAPPAWPSDTEPPGCLVAEVADTHHPEMPGRVLVRWHPPGAQAVEQWLHCVMGAHPARGDRVLIDRPANWPERLVTAVLAMPPAAKAEAENHAGPTLELTQHQSLRVTDETGRALVEVQASSQGPVVRLLADTLTLEAPKTLRLQAETIELQGGRGGVDIRTEADTVVRSRFIRLN